MGPHGTYFQPPATAHSNSQRELCCLAFLCVRLCHFSVLPSGFVKMHKLCLRDTRRYIEKFVQFTK